MTFRSCSSAILLMGAALTARADTVFTNRAAFLAATSSTTTDNFESAPVGAYNTSAGFTELGVNYVASYSGDFGSFFSLFVCNAASCGFGSFDGSTRYLRTAGAGPVDGSATGATVHVTVTLPAGITALGLDLAEYPAANGMADPLLWSLSTGSSGSISITAASSFLGFTSGSAISTLTLDFSPPDAGQSLPLELDNFTFGAAAVSGAVPEPGYLGLLAGGLLLMAGVLRRRQMRAGLRDPDAVGRASSSSDPNMAP